MRNICAADAAADAAAVLPQLQELTVTRCRLTRESLSQLLRPTALTVLQWRDVETYKDIGPGRTVDQGRRGGFRCYCSSCQSSQSCICINLL